jgi:hypothetical protein
MRFVTNCGGTTGEDVKGGELKRSSSILFDASLYPLTFFLPLYHSLPFSLVQKNRFTIREVAFFYFSSVDYTRKKGEEVREAGYNAATCRYAGAHLRGFRFHYCFLVTLDFRKSKLL